MKASYIFSANDVLANLGVIVAGRWWRGPAPVAGLAGRQPHRRDGAGGALRILKLRP
jgi:hypothetical protein